MTHAGIINQKISIRATGAIATPVNHVHLPQNSWRTKIQVRNKYCKARIKRYGLFVKKHHFRLGRTTYNDVTLRMDRSITY